MTNQISWWGEFSFTVAQVRRWLVCNKAIYIERQALQWLTWYESLGDSELTEQSIVEEIAPPETRSETNLVRHLQEHACNTISIKPALADRSVIAKPSVTLNLLPGEKTIIYVSTPVWFNAFTQPNDLLVLDIPLIRMSDSWFGPSTIEGELCYAKYTEAKLDINKLERQSHRAITPIYIHNKNDTSMAIERINVPIPYLHLYADENNHLWTNNITLICEQDGEMAEIKLDKHAPDVAKPTTLLTKPRIASEQHKLIRSIGNLFA